MSAYIIVDTRIKNPEAYEDYKAKARPIAENSAGYILPAAETWMLYRMSSGHRLVLC